MGGIKINRAYEPLITSKKRYFLLTGGRASLKSTTIHDFASRLTYEKKHGILITRYTMSSAEKSIIPEFESSIKLNGSFSDFHKSGNKYTNKHTGSFILFSGIKTNSGDQTANLKSLAGITTWIIDEGEDFQDESVFDDIDDSIRGNWNQNRVIWVQNPSTKEHFIYNRWIEGNSKKIEIEGEQVTISNHPDVEPIHTTYHIAKKMGYLSNSFLNKVEKMKQSNYKKYVHKYLGGWLDKAEGVIFENWKEGEFDDSLPYVYGMDFGYTDPTVIVKVALDKEKNNLYIDEFLYKTELKPSQIEESLLRVIGKKDLVVADNANPNLIREYYDKGINIIGCRKEKIDTRIPKVQDWNIIVTPRSHNVKKELNNFAYHDKKAEIPLDNGYDHAMDSMFYAYESLSRAGYSINW